ncbi:MAG: LamG-like jellyroll fold domain-containing protein [Planctomycetota bacterium]
MTISFRYNKSIVLRIFTFLFVLTPTVQSILQAHDGPDPIARWRFDEQAIKTSGESKQLKARLGPSGRLIGGRFLDSEEGGAIFFNGKQSGVRVSDDFNKLDIQLPEKDITVSAWVSVDEKRDWGGIVGALQDNGSEEFGWLLGYRNNSFCFAIASEGGNGTLTYLSAESEFELGKLYHVVGVYDGKTMQLYVNGKLDAESDFQSGDIVYPKSAPFTLAAYHDANEYHSHRGRVREIAIYDLAAKAAWVKHEFTHNAALASKPAAVIFDPLEFEIDPYLQYGTQDGMTVMWKSNRPSSGVVAWGESAECKNKLPSKQDSTQVHEVRIEGLEAGKQYFYKASSEVDGVSVASDVLTFTTAVPADRPFAFAVISDTQGNPAVSGKLAEFAWGQRPSFLLHPGDLVSTGIFDSHWTEHFFPSMHPLIRHVPFYSVLGNHEMNAKHYFDYVSLPDPEYYYHFQYGNTDFFMIDSNRNVAPGSEQYQWLEKSLAASTAKWKFVCHHHPPYSSDENDYGNLWKTNKGTRGDLRVRKLVQLYEKYNVDFVWNGHIHSYERTWPLREGKAVNQDGPIYMITGGGGGGLETPGPYRPFFQNTVRRGHHYAMVRINGGTIEIQAYDLENRLFDSLRLEKE